eukprot:4610334-Prymnesium_polylepis.1
MQTPRVCGSVCVPIALVRKRGKRSSRSPADRAGCKLVRARGVPERLSDQRDSEAVAVRSASLESAPARARRVGNMAARVEALARSACITSRKSLWAGPSGGGA